MKFKINPNKPSNELLIREMDSMIAGAEEKFPRLVEQGKMSEITAQFKWNVLKLIRQMIVDQCQGTLDFGQEQVSEDKDDPGPAEAIVFTVLDEYEALLGKYPALDMLRKRLDLDLDY